MNERANRAANGFDPGPLPFTARIPLGESEWPEAKPRPTRPDPGLTEKNPNRRRLRDLFA